MLKEALPFSVRGFAQHPEKPPELGLSSGAPWAAPWVHRGTSATPQVRLPRALPPARDTPLPAAALPAQALPQKAAGFAKHHANHKASRGVQILRLFLKILSHELLTS